MKKIFYTGVGAAVFLLINSPAFASILYSQPTLFNAALVLKIVDGYENDAYKLIQNNQEMSAVTGETQYTSTGWPNVNLVVENLGNHYYCAGCNGSFLLDFTSTSLTADNGVFGVGFKYINESLSYNAYVTYGDGSTQNFLLKPKKYNSFAFWGITSELAISSIHIGLKDGGESIEGGFGIDDLTIGSNSKTVAEPGSLVLFGTGLLLMYLARKINHQQKTLTKQL